MKMKETIKPIPFDMGMDVSKIKGHVRIELTDPKTGEVEVRESDNMMTNAMAEYFQNCGFLNFPNVDLNNMVIDLLGGVMAFDQPIDDDPTIVHVPAGCKMTCNGSVGTVNSSISPSELGSWVNDPEVSGWIADNVYQQTYSYLEQQGNGTISTVCLTGKNYGYVGEGNWRSNVAHPTKASAATYTGTQYAYSGVSGICFDVDLVNSTFLNFDTYTEEEEQGGETVTVKKAYLRKYRIPYSKIDLNSLRNNPILLEEIDVPISEEDWNWFNSLTDQGSKWSNRCRVNWQPLGHNMLIWNCYTGTSKTWGSGAWVQYLWTLTPQGVLTRETVTNTYGEDLYGLQAAIFDGDYCFFIPNGGDQGYGWGNRFCNSKTVYVWNRSNNDMFSIDNSAAGTTAGNQYAPGHSDYYCNFTRFHGTGDGRIVVVGREGGAVIDAVLRLAAPTNASNSGTSEYNRPRCPINGSPLIDVRCGGFNIERDSTYIASIFEVDPPIVKDATRTMKIIYTITFPTGGESNA